MTIILPWWAAMVFIGLFLSGSVLDLTTIILTRKAARELKKVKREFYDGLNGKF